MANKRISELAVRTPQTSDLMLIGDPSTGYSYKTTILDALNLGVPTTRTLTINGTTYDLSANRSWSVGTVTSVGLTMPSAFNVASSPVTSSGTIAVTAAGLASQYIRGDGTLADFPGGGGGGGASVSYYLNGSVNQGSFGGTTYHEINKSPVIGSGTDFVINANGYIASFITDAGDPAALKIPGGNWNTEFYFSASSGGGTPTYYIELYKYDGSTFTLIASSSGSPDVISGGTAIEQYFTTLAVPETVLTATDRLAIRIYVTHAGRTITLHTENSHLCQIITTFSTGLQALNGLTAQVQYFATGTSGTDFNISSSTATHTFNLPTASATNRGALSSADWTTFNNKVSSIIAGNAITVSNSSGNVTINHADTSTADPGATISGSNVFRSIVLDTYGHVTGLSYSAFSITDLAGTAISSPTTNQILSYNGTNWVNTNLSSIAGGYVPYTGATANLNLGTYDLSGLNGTFQGNVRVGTTTGSLEVGYASAQGTYKLDVNGTARITGAATFSSSVTAGAGSRFIVSGSMLLGEIISSYSTIESTSGNGIWLRPAGGSDPTGLKIATTGAATFSSSVTIGAGTALAWGARGGITQDGSWNFSWSTNSVANAFYLQSSSGNVGLGVIPSAWSIYPALQIARAGYMGANNDNNISTNGYYDGSWKYIASAAAGLYNISGNVHSWYTAPSGTAGNAISFTQAMTLDASGRLGIGTTSPASKLEVLVGSSSFRVSRTSAGEGDLSIDASGNFIFDSAVGSALIFRTNGGSERMRITSGGEVYIAGTTDQGAYNLQCNGTGVWGAGAYVNGSDIKLKNNINTITEGLALINKIRPVSFQYNDDYSKDTNVQTGFIAQELKEVFANESYLNGLVIEGPNHLNVAYQNLMAVMVKAIQELKTELDNIKSD